MTTIINIFGLTLIGLVYWFFFLKKEKVEEVSGDTIEILVKGGYQPNVIRAKAGTSLTLLFNRQDPSSCLEEVTIPAFGVRQFLPMGKKTPVTITAIHPGTYDIVCGMNMQHATLTVEGK